MKRLNFKTAFGLLSAACVLGSSPLYGSPSDSVHKGTLQVTVMDENGAVVQTAPVYIYGERKTRFVGGQNVPGTATFTMMEGDYRISSAMIKKSGDDWIDRFASNEAHIQVVPGDNTSLILVLKPVRKVAPSLSYATLHWAGIPTALVHLSNN